MNLKYQISELVVVFFSQISLCPYDLCFICTIIQPFRYTHLHIAVEIVKCVVQVIIFIVYNGIKFIC